MQSTKGLIFVSKFLKHKKHFNNERKKNLVIDDNAAILSSLSLLLDFEGYHVKTRENTANLFHNTKEIEEVDLIMLDIWLKEEDGRDICKKLKSEDFSKSKPVLMMSASRNMEESALQSGADAFVPKPFDVDLMMDKVKELTA